MGGNACCQEQSDNVTMQEVTADPVLQDLAQDPPKQKEEKLVVEDKNVAPAPAAPVPDPVPEPVPQPAPEPPKPTPEPPKPTLEVNFEDNGRPISVVFTNRPLGFSFASKKPVTV